MPVNHTSVILQAMATQKHPNNLFRSCLLHSSSANDFYSHLFSKSNISDYRGTLYDRVLSFCTSHGSSLFSCIVSDSHRSQLVRKALRPTCSSGLLDSISFMYANYDYCTRDILQGLVNVLFA